MGCAGPLTMRSPPGPACLLNWLLLTVVVMVMADTTAVQPVSMVPSTDWFGDDGQWGTVYISVGNDPQIFAVLPNTAGVDVLAVDELGGCQGVQTTDCGSERGGLFQISNSTTWQPDGGYRQANFNGLGVDSSVFANYGSDYITFNWDWSGDSGSSGSSVMPSSNISSSVAVFNSTDTWIGYIGLAAYRSDLSDLDSPVFMESIWNNRSSAPSCSYGYTAGAYYRLKGVPASLTIGGVDTLRYEPNDVSFNLSVQGFPVVSLSSITVRSFDQDQNSTSSSLFEASINSYFTLDSSTSYIWLPETICDLFSQTLNLTYNDTLGLYTYPAGVHDDLASSNVSFTFAITDTSSSLDSVNITLPFSAFDQSLSYPYPNFSPNDTSQTLPYFPIKRATDSSNFRIGRVFFQEAYLVVDYERGNFSLYQASFDSSILSNTNIIVIDPPPDSTYPGEGGTESLSQGATAGIVIGSIVGFAFILFLIWWFFLRKRYHFSVRRREPKPKYSKDEIPSNQDVSLAPRRWRKWRYRGRAEVEGDNVQPTELPTTSIVYELPGSIPGNPDRSSTPVRKQNVRRSAISTAASSTASLSSSSSRMSVSSDDSFEEEELVSRPSSSQRSSIVNDHPFTDGTAGANPAAEPDSNKLRRTQPGEIVLGPSTTYVSEHRSES